MFLLEVCRSVCRKIIQKRVHGFGLNVACRHMSGLVTWTNYLTFEPDPDYSPDAGTRLLSPISCKRYYVEFYVEKIPLVARRYTKPWF